MLGFLGNISVLNEILQIHHVNKCPCNPQTVSWADRTPAHSLDKVVGRHKSGSGSKRRLQALTPTPDLSSAPSIPLGPSRRAHIAIQP